MPNAPAIKEQLPVTRRVHVEHAVPLWLGGRSRGGIDVYIGFLLLGRWRWRLIDDRSATFLFLRGRIGHGRLFLFASRQQRYASKQTNVFFHTNHSYFDASFGRLPKPFYLLPPRGYTTHAP